jgi:hypothetical protein
MVPSESAPQELSNEWSGQFSMFRQSLKNILANFCVPPLVLNSEPKPAEL